MNNEQICSFNIGSSDFSTHAMKYENDTDRFIIHSDDIEGKNIIYAIKYSDIPQIISGKDFFANGIVIQVEEPAK
mgnify:FL=1